MAETIIVRPDNLAAELEKDMDQHIARERRRLTRGLTHMQVRLVQEAPRLGGDFAASLRPYLGEPGHTWQRGGGGNDAGASEVESVMAAWVPGQYVGIATDAPYSRKLIFHAGEDKGLVKRKNKRGKNVATGARRTYTKKVGAGWAEKIMDEANRVMLEDE